MKPPSFSGLQGNTTAAHIHSPTSVAFSGGAGVATTTPTFVGFPLGVSSGTWNTTLDLTQSSSFIAASITGHGGTTAQAEQDLAAHRQVSGAPPELREPLPVVSLAPAGQSGGVA